jgi:hypothetical protein
MMSAVILFVVLIGFYLLFKLWLWGHIENAVKESLGYDKSSGCMKVGFFVALFVIGGGLGAVVQNLVTDNVPWRAASQPTPVAFHIYLNDDGYLCQTGLGCEFIRVESLLGRLLADRDDFIITATSQIDRYTYCFRGIYTGASNTIEARDSRITLLVDFRDLMYALNVALGPPGSMRIPAQISFEEQPLSTYALAVDDPTAMDCSEGWIAFRAPGRMMNQLHGNR